MVWWLWLVLCVCVFFVFCFSLKEKGRGLHSRVGTEVHCPEVGGIRVIYTGEKPGKRRWEAAYICEPSPKRARPPFAAEVCKPRQGPPKTQAWLVAVWVLKWGGKGRDHKMPNRASAPRLPWSPLRVAPEKGTAQCKCWVWPVRPQRSHSVSKDDRPTRRACCQPDVHLKSFTYISSLTLPITLGGRCYGYPHVQARKWAQRLLAVTHLLVRRTEPEFVDGCLAAVVVLNNWITLPFETEVQHLPLSWLRDFDFFFFFFLARHWFRKLVSLIRLPTLELQSWLTNTKNQPFHYF